MASARIWPVCTSCTTTGAVVGVRLLHGVIERVLGHELDVFVDGELQILAGLRLVRDGTEDTCGARPWR